MEDQAWTPVTHLTKARDIDAWPFPLADEWAEISERISDQLRDCVPPHYVPGGFCVGEESSHGDDGPTFACVLTVNGRYYIRECSGRFARSGAYAELTGC